ncbi:hypothetical protein QGN29_10225 [Temperatibacter marinus]|uniref:Uncharacterized protein n=1 Tax=Temperatibacter marinus TaxID=1456591 RepID=A0AA52H9Q2_9PROT|nr:hypothetical protein [Temperatibacter marinus]WND01925.1 hypothetical protein QGN29_10225 [Temperatibacter marinus]
MILRKFIKHVSEQNWVAVGLDVIVVIVGIFLGMQVTNWNEGKKQESLEQEYIARLHRDLTTTIKNTEYNIRWDEARYQSEMIIKKSLDEGKLEEKDLQVFSTGLFYLGFRNELALSWQTFEELKSTGLLSIIQDKTLLKDLGNLEDAYYRRKNILNSIEDLNSTITSPLIDFYYVKSVARNQATLVFDFEKISQNKKFKNIVSNITWRTHEMSEFRMYHYKQVKRVLASVEAIMEQQNIKELPLNEGQS